MNPSDSRSLSARQKRARILLGVVGVILIAVLCAFMFGSSTSEWNAPPDARELTNPLPQDPSVAAAGKAIYAENCANCHGDSGDGKGADAWKYKVKPADFNDAGVMDKMTDGELFWKITAGRKPMPSFQNKLSDDERWMLVKYIRTFPRPPR